ncbi:MAG: TatD family hydrolase [Prevotella sp.]|nr:TatD family hydrolase [Bacteroides sp.]MCM1366538.1 TatD family hydrolase [Prevotella sp.]MCM1436848.1 TatD family hydrolase [Prevotella sp.]
MLIKDIHTHHAAPQPEGVVCVSPCDFNPVENQYYSVGIHPWQVSESDDTEQELLERIASEKCVVAIGESGIDLQHEGAAPLFKQMLLFKRHIELSERLHKPLIIHDVKAHDIILGLYKELKPGMPWIIHGFRGKPTVAKMLDLENIYFSFGHKFNPETLKSLPVNKILAETDESMLNIDEIIANLSEVRGEDLMGKIVENTRKILE